MIPHSNAPDANVIFFPFASEDTRKLSKAKALELKPKEGISAKQDIIQLRTSKPKGSAGSWSVLLSSRVNWKQLLHPGAWAMLYASDSHLTGKEEAEIDSGLKMLGIIRSVRRMEELNPETGTRTVRYLISGDDFHSVFNTPIYLNVNLGQLAKDGSDVSIANAILTLDKKFGQLLTPSEMIKGLIESLLGKPAFNGTKSFTSIQRLAFLSRGGQPYQVPKPVTTKILGPSNASLSGQFFTGMVTLFLQPDLVGKTILQSDIGRLVSTWSLIQSFCHRILNEVYTDLLPVSVNGQTRLTPSIILRAIPFSTNKSTHRSLIAMKDAKNLTISSRVGSVAQGQKVGDIPAGTGAHFYISKKIDESQILMFSSGKTDAERFNFFYVPPNLALINDPKLNEASFLRNILNVQGGKFENIGDSVSISRYGLRPYIATSDYLIGDNNSIMGTVNKIAKDIWETAHLYENGQVMIPGSVELIPVGTNIEFVERKWIAHVEQVDHIFEVNPTSGNKTYRTQISFSRLQNKKDGKPVDAVETGKPDGQIDDKWDRGISVI